MMLIFIPSTFEETFCLAAMESLAAGLVAVTTDLGALYETCAEFPIYVPYLKDKEVLSKQFAGLLIYCLILLTV
jgi:glycosyltransferase involved in cell wall biosynthesis